MKRLLDVLREDLHLTGAKEGCGEGECGACAVLMNGDLVNSCLIPVLQAEGAEITTIEGLAIDEKLHPIQQCFLEEGGAQCGICTPGMILATHHLLDKHPQPTLLQIQEGLNGNLCRCTGYMRIFNAVQQAAARRSRKIMRSNVTQYELIAPGSLDAVLQILADSPDRYTPIAGGTELMVALGAGRLQPKKLISLWNLEELRFIEVTPDAIIIGAGTTFTDIRKHPVIADEFSILAQAASWTGSIANQNRGTLGGNIVNAITRRRLATRTPRLRRRTHPRLHSRPRTMPYRDFHLAYKKTALEPDELLHSITISRNLKGYKTYIRKVGPRNAQAISKVAIAALARMNRRTHRRHPHRRRQPARIPHPSLRHRTIPPQPTHHTCNHRRRPRRYPRRSPPHRRHPQHRQISRHRRR